MINTETRFLTDEVIQDWATCTSRAHAQVEVTWYGGRFIRVDDSHTFSLDFCIQVLANTAQESPTFLQNRLYQETATNIQTLYRDSNAFLESSFFVIRWCHKVSEFVRSFFSNFKENRAFLDQGIFTFDRIDSEIAHFEKKNRLSEEESFGIKVVIGEFLVIDVLTKYIRACVSNTEVREELLSKVEQLMYIEEEEQKESAVEELRAMIATKLEHFSSTDPKRHIGLFLDALLDPDKLASLPTFQEVSDDSD